MLLAVVCAIALAALTACGSTSDGTASGSTTAGSGSGSSGAGSSGAVIMIKDFAFTTPSSVAPGAKITITNEDGTAHTVTADKGNAFDSPAPAGNSSFTAPTTPGTYPFHCNIHPEMHGTLVVK